MDKKLTEKRLKEIKEGVEFALAWYYKDRVVSYHMDAAELLEIIELAEKGMQDEEVRPAEILR